MLLEVSNFALSTHELAGHCIPPSLLRSPEVALWQFPRLSNFCRSGGKRGRGGCCFPLTDVILRERGRELERWRGGGCGEVELGGKGRGDIQVCLPPELVLYFIGICLSFSFTLYSLRTTHTPCLSTHTHTLPAYLY